MTLFEFRADRPLNETGRYGHETAGYVEADTLAEAVTRLITLDLLPTMVRLEVGDPEPGAPIYRNHRFTDENPGAYATDGTVIPSCGACGTYADEPEAADECIPFGEVTH